MTDLATLTRRLAEAEEARHKLAMGEKVVMLSYSLDGNNQRQFNQASINELKLYISELQQSIARLTGRGRRAFYVA